jgi:hypothetical protein
MHCLRQPSLSILCDQAQAVLAALESGDLGDARDEARCLVDDLDQRLRAYIDVLDRAGIALPFRRPAFKKQPNEQPRARMSEDTDGLRQQVHQVPDGQDPYAATDS